MYISDLFAAGHGPVFSFEFFPPKTDTGRRALEHTVERLADLDPGFVSVTYGAGGSTRDRTIELVADIKRQLAIEAMAHLTCVGSSRQELENILTRLEQAGVKNVIALRGDPPGDDGSFTAPADGLEHAVDLVRLICAGGRRLCIAVAGYPEVHPEAPSKQADLGFLADKVAAGAQVVITQLFFDNARYFDFVRRAKQAGISVPIVPGIMPITDVAQIDRFTTMCGASIPDDLRRRLESVAGQRDAVIELGIEYATRQCFDLLDNGAPGIHFYTLNKSGSTYEILRRIRGR